MHLSIDIPAPGYRGWPGLAIQLAGIGIFFCPGVPGFVRRLQQSLQKGQEIGVGLINYMYGKDKEIAVCTALLGPMWRSDDIVNFKKYILSIKKKKKKKKKKLWVNRR